MSQAVITKAFTQWKAQQAVDNKAVTLDEFIFANVPGLDVTKPISNTEGIPAADKIVYRQTVGKTGVVNTNAVVYSVTLGADVGDFDFNWIGLINKASGTLAMIIHAPTQRKVKNASGQQGNVLVRSMLMEYSGAQTATSITTPAETWQIDFTARLAGMDEADRLNALDIYGAGAFFDNGFLVAKTGTQYFVTKGLGYVGGLRASLAANQNIAVSAKPTKVWVDVSYQGTLTSAFKTDIKFTVAATLADYTTNGIAHYVFALASIDANGVITDLRPKGSSQYLRRDKNLTDISDPVVALNTLNGVPKTRKINKKALSSDVDLTAVDVGAMPLNSENLGNTNINTFGRDKCGIYSQTSPTQATVANGFPVQLAGILEVFPGAYTNGVIQRYTVHITGQSWFRASSNVWNGADGPWSNWVQSSTVGSVSANTALGSTDLNTVGYGLTAVQAAIYHQSANASATADRNYPEAKAGTLFVTGSAYGCQQMFITFDTCNIWVRGLSSNWNGKDGPWRPWVAMYGTNNKPTAADVGAWTAAQSAASEKALADEIATAFKIRANLAAADTPNTLRGSNMFGHYGVPGVAAATTEKGYPMNGFVGVIFVTWGPNATQQIAFNNNGRQFTRSMTGAWNGVDGPWSAWNEIYCQANKPTSADVGLGLVGNFAAVQQGGGVGMQTNKVYIGWTGAKVKIQVDASDMGEVYTTKFPPPQRDSYTKTESDGRYIYRDTSTTVGFVSGNANDPYIRHSTSNTVVVLPTREQLQNEIAGTRNWANRDLRNDIYAYGDNRYVYDVQRGSQALENGSFVAQADWEAPTGCFMTGIKNRVDLGDARTMGKYYRALMVRTASGGWRQVGN